MKKLIQQPEYISTIEAAKLLGVSREAIDHYCRPQGPSQPLLPSQPCPCGQGRMIRRTDVLSFKKPTRGRPKIVRN